jgi:hypothetical protein
MENIFNLFTKEAISTRRLTAPSLQPLSKGFLDQTIDISRQLIVPPPQASQTDSSCFINNLLYNF